MGQCHLWRAGEGVVLPIDDSEGDSVTCAGQDVSRCEPVAGVFFPVFCLIADYRVIYNIFYRNGAVLLYFVENLLCYLYVVWGEDVS